MKRKTNAKMTRIRTRVTRIIVDKHREGFMGIIVKVLVFVVIGALLLAGLYALFDDSILPELQNRTRQMFGYSS